MTGTGGSRVCHRSSSLNSRGQLALSPATEVPYPLLFVYIMVIYIMLDLSRIEGFDWDEGNSRKSVERHDVSQTEAEQIFFNDPLLVVEDVSHSAREVRLHALGRTDAGRLLHISFTLRDDNRLIRVISARTMHRKERLRYEQEA
jgi:uncharacterized protein